MQKQKFVGRLDTTMSYMVKVWCSSVPGPTGPCGLNVINKI